MADSKSNKITNVPNLRFPFYDTSWSKKKLKDVCEFYKGTVLSKGDLSDSGHPCILYGQLYTTYKKETIKSVISKTKRTDNNLFYGKANDVIIPASGETPEDISTACCVLEDDILFGGDLNVLRSNHNGSFLSFQLNGKRKFDIAKLAVGKSVVHLHNEQLKSLVCFFPNSIEEESKIVSLLDALDDKIDTQNKIIEDLKCLETSLINQLFNSFTKENEINFLDLFTEYKILNSDNLPQFTIGKYGIKEMEQSDLYTREKHVVFNENSLILGIGIEECGVSLNLVGSCSPIYKTYSINNKRISYSFADIFIKKYLENKKRFITQKSTRRDFEIKYSDLNNISFNVPPLEKQTIYSNMINSIRNKITNELELQRKYENQKSYFLQNLFI